MDGFNWYEFGTGEVMRRRPCEGHTDLEFWQEYLYQVEDHYISQYLYKKTDIFDKKEDLKSNIIKHGLCTLPNSFKPTLDQEKEFERLSYFAKSKLQHVCTKSHMNSMFHTLVVKGVGVALSEVINDKGEIILKCGNKDINMIYVLALGEIYIDRKFHFKGNDLRIALVAPKMTYYRNFERFYMDVNLLLISNRFANTKNIISNPKFDIDTARVSILDETTLLNQAKKFELTEIIREYKNYVEKNLENPIARDHLEKESFLTKIRSNINIRKFDIFRIKDLIQQAAHLEQQYSVSKTTKTILSDYELLLKGAKESLIEQLDERYDEYKKVLRYLLASISSRITYLKSDIESNLIIDVAGYLEVVKDDLNNLSAENGKINLVEKYKESYGREIDKKILEAHKVIEQSLMPEFGRIQESTEKTFYKLVNETIKLQEQTVLTKFELRRKKQELEDLKLNYIICSAVKIAGLVLSLFHPYLLLVGSTIGFAATVAESTFQENVEVASTAAPPAGLDHEAFVERPRFKRQLQLQKNSFQKSLQTSATKRNSNIFVRKRISKRSTALAVSEVVEKRIQSHAVALDKIGTEIGGAITKYNKYSKRIKDLELDMAKVEKYQQKLENFKRNITDSMLPYMNNVVKRLRERGAELEGKSRVSLEYEKWQIQDKLKRVALMMTQMAEGFKVQPELTLNINSLSELFTSTIKSYDHIQHYGELHELADYIANINSPVTKNIDIEDKEFKSAILKFDKTLETNLILHRYKIGQQAFKQFVFPLAEVYLKGKVSVFQLEKDYQDSLLKKAMNSSSENLRNEETNVYQMEKSARDHILKVAEEELNYLTKTLKTYKKSIQRHDRYIGAGEFSSHYISTKPFYVWHNKDYKIKFSELLSGKEIVVYSNITNSEPKQDAIKFNRIEFTLKASDNQTQAKINDLLRSFQISATHSGNSYYRFNNSIYSIESGMQNIWYNFEKIDYTNEPVHTSSAYDKIKTGDFMLSPFAFWTVQISNLTDQVSFENLTDYKDKVDLELGGRGFYVDMGKVGSDIIQMEAYDSEDYAVKRVKRSIDGEYAMSSAAPGLSSPINYICNMFNEIALNLNPIKQIKSFFSNTAENEDTLNHYDAVFYKNDLLDNSLKNENLPFVEGCEVKNISKAFISHHSGQSQGLNFAPYNIINNENLALLNFAVHMINNVKYDQKSELDNLLTKDEDLERAQKLAFFAQIPKPF